MSENLKQFFNLLANNPEIKEKALACNELGKEKGLLALIAFWEKGDNTPNSRFCFLKHYHNRTEPPSTRLH